MRTVYTLANTEKKKMLKKCSTSGRVHSWKAKRQKTCVEAHVIYDL